VLLGWPRETGLQIDFLKVLPKLERLRKSLIIGRIQPRHLYPREGIARTVHVWWGGLQRNSDLMLLLAYLLTRNPEWRGAHVKVLSIATSELMKEQTERYLAKLIPEIRIEAEVEVLLKSKEESVSALIHKQSRDAEVVFLGLATPPPGQEAEYADRLEKLAGDLPTVFFVKNASMFMGDLLGAEEEKAAPPLPEQKEMPRSQSPGGP
jgi:potassium/chloride transporter 4/5/6